MNIWGRRVGLKGGEGSTGHKLFLEELSLLVMMKNKQEEFQMTLFSLVQFSIFYKVGLILDIFLSLLMLFITYLHNMELICTV